MVEVFVLPIEQCKDETHVRSLEDPNLKYWCDNSEPQETSRMKLFRTEVQGMEKSLLPPYPDPSANTESAITWTHLSTYCAWFQSIYTLIYLLLETNAHRTAIRTLHTSATTPFYHPVSATS
jgi:uncharacterized Zn-finger protein